MGFDTSGSSPVELVPCNPPLELIERDGNWVVREYHDSGERPEGGVTRFGTRTKRIDAMRAGKERMDQHQHPCLLRWDSKNNVGGIYWNSDFEQLSVQFSSLLGNWIVKTERDDIVLSVNSSASDAVSAGKQIVDQYDFKRLECYSKTGDKQGEHEHRFVRNGIADYGVRFNRGQIPKSAETPADSSETDDDQTEPIEETLTDEQDEEADSGQFTQAGIHRTLAAALPDVTKLQAVDTDGVVHTYDVPWDDGTARVLVLNPEYVDEQRVVNAFATAISDWLALTTHSNVVEVFESAPDPATWIIYNAEHPRLSAVADDLSGGEQMRLLSQLGDVISAAQREGIYRTGLSPDTVHVNRSSSIRTRMSSNDMSLNANLTEFGLGDRVPREVGRSDPTRFTPPELLNSGTAEQTTPVYRLGAVAYYFVTGRPPYYSCSPTADALAAASVTPPHEIMNMSLRTSQCVMRALHETPRQRYETGERFVSDFINSVE